MRIAILTGALWCAAATSFAQAWTPPAGNGSINLTIQRIDNTGHLLDDGALLPDGKSIDAAIHLETDYAVTDKLVASVGVPLVFAKYVGPGPTPFNFLPVDLCYCWHSGWQDVSLGIRYSLLNGKTGLTPSFSVGVPSNDYDYRGEAVVGRRLREIRLGVDAGRQLDVVSPRLSVQGQYAYSVVQRVLEIRNDRSNVAIEPAFLVTPRLSARAIMTWQRTHGGLRLPVELTTEERIVQHDRLLRDNSFHLGFGIAYSLRRIDLYGSYVGYVSGTNSHAGRALTAGISWPFYIGS